MAQARWTYEVPAAGTGSAGLEEYVIESRNGEPAGKVVTVLEREDRLYLAIERGTPPLRHDLRAVPWEEVDDVDHTALAVRLKLSSEAIGEALQLDPGRQVEGGPAEAVRVDFPGRRPSSASPETPGPVDRPLPYATMFGAGALGLIVLLALVLFDSTSDFGWEYLLFAIPVALFVFSLVTAYRLFRRPYQGVGPGDPSAR
jgi:hypothetical protein